MKQVYAFLFVVALASPFYGQFTTTTVVSDLPVNGSEMVVEDMNNDGLPDIVLASGLDILVSLNQGNMSFASPQIIGSDSYGIFQFYCHDYDDDGLKDIVYFDGSGVAAFHHESLMNFSPPFFIYEPVDFSADALFMGIGDIDNDGTDDIIALIFFPEFFIVDGGSAAIVGCRFDYVADDGFTAPIPFNSGFGYDYAPYGNQAFEVVDIFPDGINDLIYLGMGTWDPQIRLVDGSTFTLEYGGSTYGVPVFGDDPAWDCADIDNDGDLDFVLGQMNGGSIRVHLNDGTGYGWDSASDWLGQMVDNVLIDDVNSDGFADAIVSGSFGSYPEFPGAQNGTYVFYNDGTGHFPGFEQGEPSAIHMTSMQRKWQAADMNGDGINEYVGTHYGDNQVVLMEATSFTTTIFGNVFYDENFSEWYDSADIPLHNQPVLFDNATYYYTDLNGAYNIPAGNGTHTLLADFDQSLWVYTTSPTYVTEVVDGSAAFNNLPFGRMPIGSVNQLSATINKISGTCNEIATHEIHITNTGNSTTQGTITLTLDPLFGFTDSNVDEVSISGNTISWNYEGLWPTHSFSIEFYGLAPDENSAGEEVMHSIVTTAEDDLGNILNTFTDDETYILECSFDPNDKTTNTGWTESGYILANTELDYTIRFQNTGNATATNVRVEDQLSELLQWNTLQPIAWSHDFDLMIDETGRAIFNFENIMLPDSASDEEGSHGFVRFTILQNENLPALTEIENTAEIFFDLNEPVITNTTLNTVFDCDMMTYNILMETQMCSGNIFSYDPEVQYAETFEWTFDDLAYSNTEEINYTPETSGVYDFELTASNPLCEITIPVGLQVSQTPPAPIVTQNGNMLTATGSGTYFWFFNDMLQTGNTENTFELSETGWVSVYVVSDFCASGVSDEGFFNYVGVDEVVSLELKVVPNPFTDFFIIQFSSFSPGDYFTVTDAMGRVVMKEMITATEIRVDAGSLASGVYEIRTSNNTSSEKIVKE